MHRVFKAYAGVKLPYFKQGLIYFTCVNYPDLSEDLKSKINRLCSEIGFNYADALFAVVTTEDSVLRISYDYHVSESVLYRLRRKFYMKW